MARILLLGYFGAGNFGDEALLADWLIRHGRQMRDLSFELDVVVREVELFRGMPSAQKLSGMLSQRIDQKQALRLNPGDYQALVLPGGSILQDSTSVKSLGYYLWFLRRFSASQCRIAMLNQGIGPISSWLGSTFTPIVLRGIDFLSLRDEASFEWARLRRIDGGNCEVMRSCDPIFFYDQPPLPGFERRALPEQYIAYIPRRSGDLPALDDLTTEAQAAAKLIREAVRITGLPCVLVPYAPGDYEFGLEIERECVGDARLAPDAGADNPDIWQSTRSAELVISSRLHGVIAAAGAGRPFVGIACDQKISQHAVELGMPWIFPARQHFPDCFSQLADLWEHRETLSAAMKEKLRHLHNGLNASDHRFRQII